MLRKILKRSAMSFAFSSVIGQIIVILMMLFQSGKDFVPMVPSYRQSFSNDVIAITVYFILIGVIGAAFGACSVIFELEKWSWLKQGVIHFVLTTIVWLPIATFVWGLSNYPKAVVTTFISMTITYLIIWSIQYRIVKKSIREINEKLDQMES